MDFVKYVTENCLVLIPVLYVVGMIFKGIEIIPDKYIPLILLPIGVAFSCAICGFNADSIIQGILVVGATVYTNQLIVQAKKAE